jgi:ParB family chromosome partitioning protein
MNAETSKRKHLGRGLDALFGEQEEADAGATESSGVSPGHRAVMNCPIDLLAPSPLQPRRHFDEGALTELAASIAENGVLQPLLARPDPRNPGRFELIAGERRWRAAQRAQLHDVPVMVKDLSDSQVLEVALIENLQRQDLSPVEEARGYERLSREFGHTQEHVGEIVGKSRAHVANMLRLLTLPEAVLDMLDAGQLTAGQARPLIGLSGAEAAARQIVKRGLNARQAERLARGFGRKRKLIDRGEPKDADTVALEKSLEQATGYQVKIAFDGVGGTVTIAYANLEQLDDIARRLSSSGRTAKARDPRDPDTVDLEELLQRNPFPLEPTDSAATPT